MPRPLFALQSLLWTALLPGPVLAHAGIQVPPRVVFHDAGQDRTLTLRHRCDKRPLAQAWLDQGGPDAAPQAVQASFLSTPARIREPESSCRLRIVALSDAAPLPRNGETRHFLDLLDIPSRRRVTDDASDNIPDVAAIH